MGLADGQATAGHCPGVAMAGEELRAVQKFDRDEFGPPQKCICKTCAVKVSCSVMSNAWPPMNCSPPGSVPRSFPGKNTGVGFLLQEIFPVDPLLVLGCPNKVPQTGQLTEQNFIVS